ncbi:RNA polymerase sigma factor [Streptomyces sp. ST2-7A]|uniref:RNA polymerase sigma factor n=1 Tax=Streptomyces sp. ST2-7A TaxID=2907214 RepID=UPI001F3B509A|nr:sigma-70 family RNA polymerase sigma factor [Streptomyces sp. ST2-7A]MCE7082932.1 sigma-70 family RNA polymerase sigma factor [Streptomyces sp. ST2-7A]
MFRDDDALPRRPGEDARLTAEAAKGDQEAFETLVRRHTPELLRLAGRLVGPGGDPEDIVQEAFVTAWRRLPEFRGDAAFRSWMFRIVTNRCLNHIRARPPLTGTEVVPEAVPAGGYGSPIRTTEAREAMRDLLVALGRLPEDQRACWILRELHGLSYEEIAGVVGVEHPTVRGRIHRARRMLTEEMSAWR